MKNPMASIVIPTRNEAADISATLEACLALDYEPKEIIVVDDSTDNTPEIIRTYAARGVRLIHRQDNRNGCCGARNAGMRAATGEIIVLLNADDRPGRDFIGRIIEHYRAGADFVLVRSVVQNRDNRWGEFIHASGLVHFHDSPDHTWSEGFSCRRDAAAAIGYIPGDFPVPFCRDNELGIALRDGGYVMHRDLSIPMEHVSPSDAGSYWRNQVWRATFCAPHAHYFGRLPVWAVAVRETAKAARNALRVALVVPLVWSNARAAKYAGLGIRAVPRLALVDAFHEAAGIAGLFKGVGLLLRQKLQERGTGGGRNRGGAKSAGCARPEAGDGTHSGA